jgi:retron-type reverse transcriptase
MNDQTLWDKVCSNHNLRLAWTKVKEKGGGPGVDHMTLDDFERNLDEIINNLQNLLERGDYKPFDATSKIEALLEGGFKWIFDGDIENFFDPFDHDFLLSFVAERVS